MRGVSGTVTPARTRVGVDGMLSGFVLREAVGGSGSRVLLGCFGELIIWGRVGRYIRFVSNLDSSRIAPVT